MGKPELLLQYPRIFALQTNLGSLKEEMCEQKESFMLCLAISGLSQVNLRLFLLNDPPFFDVDYFWQLFN